MTKPQLTILLIEDDLVDRMACRRALAHETNNEFHIYETETGREGLHLAIAKNPDCVLLDYNLPDMNGLEFLAELRNDQDEVPIPVIMLTGADNASVAVEAMKRGAQDYLVKDTNRQYLELLPSVIQRVLRERRALIEKKLMESRLVRAEAKYRFLIEQIPAIIYTASLEIPGKLLYVSPQLRSLGYSPEEWTAQVGALRSRIHPDDHKRAVDAFDHMRATGKPLRCEYRLLNSSGEVCWFLDEARLEHDESGKPLLLQGILIDITEDKKVEEELRLHRRHIEDLVLRRTDQLEKQAEVLNSANTNLASKLDECKQSVSNLKKYADHLEDIFNNAPSSYHLLDPDGVIIQINDTGLKMLGRTRKEVVGSMKFIDLLTPSSSNNFLESNNHCKESGWISKLELEIARKDGTHLSVLLSANTIKDANGHIMLSRGIMFDISDHKHAERL